MSHDLIELVGWLGSPHVLVVGDLMLDRYVWGDAERISQEAPVILLHADRREERLGGASSVATMLRALGARVSITGLVGTDADGLRIRAILDQWAIDHEGVATAEGRISTVKERYIGRAQQRHPQQIVRVDYETREPADLHLEHKLIASVEARIDEADIVLISDYDKGVCTPGFLAAVIAASKRRGIRVVADPIRGRDYSRYRGCSAMTPNRLEAGLALGRNLATIPDALRAAHDLRDQLEMEAGIVTLDKDGMAMAHRDGREMLFPTRPRQVYDITGAGDMVMSVLAMALAAGADYDAAIRLANIAGGLEVEKIGVATLSREELLADLQRTNSSSSKKTHSREVLLRELQEKRAQGSRIAFTNGCFDVLHKGHVEYLEEARAQADVLVVGLNSDTSVQLLKGPARPVNDQEARSVVLAGLQAVDFVTIFEESTPLALIKAIRPDVLVKGADYQKADVVGGAFVESYGGRVYLAPVRGGYSTSNILRKLGAA
ncbi:MAG TPA: D-glycero-beta-D-manno-heptose 1-phosphate adenylyltransferase [Gemmataceae bacterium]|jgi:D-beta-D-heptose 7-phosphate kinase/D-beta-D-heptose 1-phosphate adenosyltransferase|nr:D-glycero-beta-D-manno-heptose 1-phosphate adenylyltransferase [Gemmataceae bacterium]